MTRTQKNISLPAEKDQRPQEIKTLQMLQMLTNVQALEMEREKEMELEMAFMEMEQRQKMYSLFDSHGYD